MRFGFLFLGRRGGHNRFAFNLARALSDRLDLTLYLSSANDRLTEWAGLGCRIRTFRTMDGLLRAGWETLTLTGPRRIARAIDRDRPEVILDAADSPWSESVKRLLRTGPQLVDIVHEPWPTHDRLAWAYRLQEVLQPRRAPILVSLSQEAQAILKRRYPGARHLCSRLILIHAHGPVDPARKADQRRKLLCLGRLEAYKGLDLLVGAFTLARRSEPDLELTVASRGRLAPGLAERLGSPGIRLINRWLSDEEFEALLATHGQAVLPYLTATQSGIALAAMGNGLPCVATRVGGLPEQIIDGRTGLLVPPGDKSGMARAMVRIAADPELARDLARNSLELARTRYAAPRVADDLLDRLGPLLSLGLRSVSG